MPESVTGIADPSERWILKPRNGRSLRRLIRSSTRMEPIVRVSPSSFKGAMVRAGVRGGSSSVLRETQEFVHRVRRLHRLSPFSGRLPGRDFFICEICGQTPLSSALIVLSSARGERPALGGHLLAACQPPIMSSRSSPSTQNRQLHFHAPILAIIQPRGGADELLIDLAARRAPADVRAGSDRGKRGRRGGGERGNTGHAGRGPSPASRIRRQISRSLSGRWCRRR